MGAIVQAVKDAVDVDDGDEWKEYISDAYEYDAVSNNYDPESQDAKDARFMMTLSTRYPPEHKRFWQIGTAA